MRIDLEEIISLCSNQEESDARFILCINHAKMIGFKNVVIRSPDTDVFLFLLYYTCDMDITIYLGTVTGKKRQLINAGEKAKEYENERCKILLGVYVLGKTVSVLSKVKAKSNLYRS